MIEIELPYPPTVNTYYRSVPMRKGRKAFAVVKISKQGREYRKAVAEIVKASGVEMQRGAIAVRRLLYCPDWRMRDEDNTTKALYDSLAHAGAIEGDHFIVAGSVKKFKDADGVGRVVVQIKKVDGGVIVKKAGAWLE